MITLNADKMKSILKYAASIILIITFLLATTGCGTPHLSMGVGVGVHSGPHGPTISPSWNVGVSGGRGGWYY